jgi:hypothetical protein
MTYFADQFKVNELFRKYTRLDEELKHLPQRRLLPPLEESHRKYLDMQMEAVRKMLEEYSARGIYPKPDFIYDS